MRIIADLHIHSKHSRACSTDLTLENLEKWAKIKGVGLLGTGDFSHPVWQVELKKKLTEDGSGILRTASGFPFVLQNEISLVYTQDGKGRRVHLVILAPDFETVDKITGYLKTKGRVDYDGRPIFKISCVDFAREMRRINPKIEVIPAHVWTPYFGLFGSKTGFDSVEEAFKEESVNIHALETGLSSDPAMNWTLKRLDKYNLVSFSDLHSFWPWRIGREATVFDLPKLTYDSLLSAIRTGEGLVETIEVDPNYGKYHFDGHAACKVVMSPQESAKAKGLCPKCGRPLTIGVQNRVEALADRKIGERSPGAKPFLSLIPLHEVLALALGSSVNSKKVWALYNEILKAGENEYDVLMHAPREKLLLRASADVVDLILLNRAGKIEVKPGYDGEYGVPVVAGKAVALESEDSSRSGTGLGEEGEGASECSPKKQQKKQKGLSEFF